MLIFSSDLFLLNRAVAISPGNRRNINGAANPPDTDKPFLQRDGRSDEKNG